MAQNRKAIIPFPLSTLEFNRAFLNKEVTRYYGQETLEKKEQAEVFVDFLQRVIKKGIRWGIQLKDTEQMIGTIGFNNWSPTHKRAEIGYEIHPDHWRKGYTSEAVSKVIQYGFDVFGLTRIGAVVFMNNKASSHLLTKCGFVKEGVLRDYMYQDGSVNGTYMYSLLKRDR
ncbi:N-acetyltransferase [Halobacillus fulvus]|nr:N-acetyltransferase [Halobacillus fulvus]